MGAQLVGLVLARWAPHLSDRAFRVLVRMAHTALDNDAGPGKPAGVYFAGHELLALTLRSERGGSEEAVLKTVQRAVAELVRLGAVERISAAHRGSVGSYRLRLEAGVKGDISGPPLGDTSGPPFSGMGDTSSPERGTPADPPRNHEEPYKPQEPKEEPSGDLRTAVTVARANTAEKGNGFCLVCYDSGQFTLAVDSENGSTCMAHRNVIPIRRSA